MKKIASMTLTLAVIGVAYTASAWYLGKNVEAKVNQQYDNLMASQPYLKIVDRDYRRGIFQSEETVTLALADKIAAAGGPDAQPLELKFHSRIQHGPFPGFSTLGAATSETELVLSDETQAKMRKLLGDASPFLQSSHIQFDGSGSAHFSSPRFEVEFPDKQGELRRITWEGFDGRMDFTPDARAFTLHLLAPKLEISDSNGVAMTLSDIAFEGDQQQMFEDLPFLYSGTSHFAIGKLSIDDGKGKTGPVVVQRLVYDVDIPRQGDYLDVITRTGADNLSIGKESIGPAHMDISFRHLHARAVAALNQKMMSIYSDPNLQGGSPEALVGQMAAQLQEDAQTILAHDPQINIDRLSLSNPDGEAKLAAQVKLVGLTLEEITNPFMLMTKIEANGDLSLPEEMIVQLLRKPPFSSQGIAELSPEEIEARGKAAADQFQMQVAMLTDQGYLNREGNLVKTNLSFKAGQLKINGKPFVPMAQTPQQ